MGLRAFRTGRAGAVVAWASTSWRRRAASSLSAPADSARAWRPRAPRSPATGPFPDAEASPVGEAEEHDHHQHRRGGDDAARALQAVGDGTVVVAAFFVALLDARQQHRAGGAQSTHDQSLAYISPPRKRDGLFRERAGLGRRHRADPTPVRRRKATGGVAKTTVLRRWPAKAAVAAAALKRLALQATDMSESGSLRED